MNINFSTLTQNAIITFDKQADVLVFDDPAASAADVTVVDSTQNNLVGFTYGGKTVFLDAMVIAELVIAHVSFADGSQLQVGDITQGVVEDAKANLRSGTNHDDQLIGLDGDDRLDGGGGNDKLVGNRDIDTLIGGDGLDQLDGGLDDDILHGGGGADTQRGGKGADRFEFATAGESPAATSGFDRIEDFNSVGPAQDIDHIVYLERGTNANYLESTNQKQQGFEGALETANLLFVVGEGFKSYVAVEDADGVYLFADLDHNYQAEFCVLLEKAFIREFSADRIITETGSPGNDRMQGGPTGDRMNGGGGSDRIEGGGGDDTLKGGKGKDKLIGGDGDDTLDGGAGADTLQGGRGRDVLTGGTQADRFVYLAPSESSDAVSDVITDFLAGQDAIVLSAIDAVRGTAADDEFTFIGNNAFSNTAGELSYVVSTGRIFLLGDTDGDGAADLRIVLRDLTFIAEADIVL